MNRKLSGLFQNLIKKNTGKVFMPTQTLILEMVLKYQLKEIIDAPEVGDKYDTSPYRLGEDQKGITTIQYVINMSKLIVFVNSQKEN